MSDLDAWLDALMRFRSENVFNPWWDEDVLDAGGIGHGHTGRALRLKQHLECSPMLLLIGEAPGYQGCHFSGVPFTNEKLLLQGCVPRVQLLPEVLGLTPRITTRRLPFCEPSATIVWDMLHKLGIADRVVMWNAFAWHPHKPGNLMSNRAPTKQELGEGLPILRGLLAMFNGVPVVPIGKVAERTLANLRIAALPALRHPAMGGANAFRNGLRHLISASGIAA
jgi:uracil-DNA glycosylase